MSDPEQDGRSSSERPEGGPPDEPRDGAPPEQTTDDTDVGWGEATDPEDARDDHEQWLLDQRPPHWG